VVIINPETLEILFQDEVERLKNENAYNDYFYLSASQERNIKKEIETRYRGGILDYDQCIHDRCLALLQKPENYRIMEQIRLANRQNMPLPDPLLHNKYPIEYTSVEECQTVCLYCRGQITSNNPGFAYCLKSDRTRCCRYLHIACYEGLLQMRKQQRETDERIRRTFMHLLSSGYPAEWTTYSVRELAIRNDAWFEFLARYHLTFDEREVLSEWLNFIDAKKQGFTESELVEIWLPSLKYPDISLIVSDSLSGQSYDQLTVSELIMRTLIDSPQQTLNDPPGCITTPEPCFDEDGFPMDTERTVRYEAASPSGGHPPLLFLNLVQTLLQRFNGTT
jgi:hypothetical protein